MNKCYVLIGVDCDHDRKRFNQSIKDKEISWSGFKYFYRYFNKIRERIAHEFGLMPVLTLNIRSDKQIKEVFGKYDACFDLFEKYLANDFNQKDEIAWHHHQWRLRNNAWIQETDDKEWLRENIFQSFEAVKKYDITTLHTGWCFQNTLTMNYYNDLGIKIDYSALPKMSKTTGNFNKYDWQFVENNQVYVPDRNNYQKKDSTGQNKILEVPVTTARNHFLNFLRLVENFQKTKQIKDFGFQNTYLNVTVNPFLYNIFLKNVFSQNALEYFVTFFHSDELLVDKLKAKQTQWLYRQDNIYHNLKRLIELAKENNRVVEFINFKDFLQNYEKN